ncbi:TonB-dependent receptor plug domain-containing protein [Thiolapillus sp.]
MKNRSKHCLRGVLIPTGLLAPLLLATSIQAKESVDDYIDLPLADLLSMEVTSVSKKKQQLNEVAAAVFVITEEDIRRSGVTSIPEALRMAPGIQVGRIDSNKWAITSRGLDNQFSNMLLVMIDGRTVYNSAFSGVYWDVQDTLLEDIERIEVIRGPGATIWGANAVNGVINIITKQAQETVGGLLSAGAGNEEKAFAGVRYGVETDNGIAARFYMKYNDRDGSYAPNTGGDAGDSWQSLRGGFRIDGQTSEADSWTLHGDVYQADENQRLNLWKDPADPANIIYAPFYLDANKPDAIDSSGWNILGKWDRQLSPDSNASLQIYIDQTKRSEGIVSQQQDTIDLDFQHQYQGFEGHDIIWGLGYRRISDEFDNSFVATFLPDHRTLDLYNAYVQDELELTPDTLRLTFGSKFEHNDYTGMEVQPNARLVWLPNETSTLWGSISRAVRTPSRLDRDTVFVPLIVPLPPDYAPVVIHILGSDEFEAEELIAYETGYRVQPRSNLSLDLALFYNDYDMLQSFEPTDPANPPSDLRFDNEMTGYSYGLELSLDWRPLEWWRLQTNYSFLELTTSPTRDSTDRSGTSSLGEHSYPKHQASLRSMMDLGNDIKLDLWVYYVDDLRKTSYSFDIPTPAYTSLNARLAWYPLRGLELSVVGQNLLDDHHLEFMGESLLSPTEVERSAYAQIRLEF